MTFDVLLLFIFNIVAISLTFVFVKEYKKDAPIFYSAIRMLFTSLIFVIAFFILGGAQKGISFNKFWLLILLVILFVLCYFFTVLALKEGPMSISSLIFAFALLIPAVYGIIFQHNTVGLFFYFGLALFILCIIFINLEPKNNLDKKSKITFKWLVYVLIAAISDGVASIIISIAGSSQSQNPTDIIYDGVTFLMLGFLVATIVLFVIALIREKSKLKSNLKSVSLWGGLCGIFTGISFILMMYFTNLNIISNAIYFPVYSGGQIILCSLIGMFWYKEKFRPIQYLGIVLGIISVIFLNL